MRFPQGWELVVLLVLVLVLFGSKRLPDAARGLGRSLRIFKSEVNELREDDKSGTTDQPGTPEGTGQPRPEPGAAPDQSDPAPTKRSDDG